MEGARLPILEDLLAFPDLVERLEVGNDGVRIRDPQLVGIDPGVDAAEVLAELRRPVLERKGGDDRLASLPSSRCGYGTVGGGRCA